jgi:FtsP/CotA-like multicopper oxidase with cupredoxin domain
MKKVYILLLLGITVLVLFLATSSINKNNTDKLGQTESAKQEQISLKNGEVYNLTASYITKNINGVPQKMLAYNGSVPGPTIQVEQGNEITVNFKNETDTNQLLHSHGVRMENAYDGTTLVQKEIKPGETFVYKLKFPDPGVYWYHPHVEEVYGQARGLYGAFVVKPKDPNYFPKVNTEMTLFLSDILLENNQIETKQGDADHQLMGHYGNVMLTNGQENYNFTAKKGEVVRMYIVNSANARPFNFTINGTKMKLVGGDSGAYERASFVDSVLLGPSERAIVDVYFEKSGVYALENKTPANTYNLGSVNVFDTQVDQSFKTEFSQLQSNQDTISSIEKYRSYFNKAPDKKLTLTISMMGNMMQDGQNNMMSGMRYGMMGSKSSAPETVELMGMQMTKEQAVEHCKMMPNMNGCAPYLTTSTGTPAHTDGIEWEDTMAMMSRMATKNMLSWKIVDEATKKENMDVDWTLKKDQPVKIEIYNDPNSPHPMQHPIHFHGQRFLVLSRNGVKETNLVWKDTALVRAGETVEILLIPSNPGSWMAHCHISEHLANGMMFLFKVEE